MRRTWSSRIPQCCTRKATRQCQVIGKRYLATAAPASSASELRNMALVAHIDSGKTTLTESILLKSSYLIHAGSVDTGSTTTDFLPAERERGITIQSASIPVKWRDWTFNLIDTPGHADFGMEVESASRVVDGAVVLLDSVEGVEAQTKGVWKQLDRYGVGSRLIFLNKLDRVGASFSQSLTSLLANRLHPRPVPLALPIASFDSKDYAQAEPGIQGLVDLVKWELWRWNKDGESIKHVLPQNLDELEQAGILPPSHPVVSQLLPARTSLLENVSMFSDELMETLLGLPSDPSAYLTVPVSKIMPHLRAATLRSDILPVLCGSAFKHIGTELVMDYVGELFPSPVDVAAEVPKASAPLRMLAWKVTWDKRKGWMTFVRVYSGECNRTLTKQSVVLNATRQQRERISKIQLLYASQAQDVDSLSFGQVGVILGLRYTRTGDTLVSTHKASEASSLRDIVPPPPVMSASIIPQMQSDTEPVQEALASLARTDPSVRFEVQEGQILVHGLGSLHLEIIENRLREEWQANFEFGKRRVSYREGLGPNEPKPTQNAWSTEVSGKTITVSIDLSVRELQDDEQGDALWDDNVVLGPDGKPLRAPDDTAGLIDPLAIIARGISSVLSTSPHTSLALSHLHVQVNKYNFLSEQAPPSVLAGASAFVLRDCIKNAGMGDVMEPYIRLKITAHEDSVGKVVKDLTEHGGEVLDLGAGASSGVADPDAEAEPFSEEGIYIPPKELSPSAANASGHDGTSSQYKRTVVALAPLSQMLDYSNRLRALSGGHGHFDMVNAGFRKVSQARKMEILREIGRA
ncbi:P-loop containing nucleoside triphosphate hydrolase protein [Daedalea quercina L-15889]|uniref:p-loop containing nucleoside triphosphate hydrolase protein n=1 Tax=Daedalea quercina L-15889 TaxID=1314783 RepID=A0A165U313_9APHY|nr:P-loop containing nucleoside triphosphate hydrolase protein [Daedalea quercina L-15889]